MTISEDTTSTFGSFSDGGEICTDQCVKGVGIGVSLMTVVFVVILLVYFVIACTRGLGKRKKLIYSVLVICILLSMNLILGGCMSACGPRIGIVPVGIVPKRPGIILDLGFGP